MDLWIKWAHSLQIVFSHGFDFQSVEGFATYDSDLNNHNLMSDDVDTFQTLGTFDTNCSSSNLDITFTPSIGIITSGKVT